ncbi:multidrug resistance-associated protein 5 [Cordyceps fumosorosea ARSEF 2679]|uniref:Multidrug resistance-associated protein 5 n=1 Tax=Cordyceps fumosorosea (strain ARSEF 2679) TaxID=1081104 RepID=A0A168DDE1_CORFA|nr:multidrug resistance-associated protein 5 [Cordyceps fumosorosea ARSEF 2679]OAA72471.1 multidrug resistance-associated protein 5 [Cordyceps fumosorosea ARSEF 2679]
MADEPEKELQTPDALAATVAQQDAPSHNVAKTQDMQPSDKSDTAESRSVGNEKSHDSSNDHETNELKVTETNATDASVGTTATGLPPQENKTWRQKLNPLRWGGIPEIPHERIVSREYGASIFSKLFFNWMTPLMTTGYKRQLHERDLWAVNPDRGAEVLTNKVRAAFKRRIAKGSKRPLLMALYDSFTFEFWLSGFCALISTMLQVIAPFTLRYLIQFATEAYYAHVQHTAPPHIGEGVGLAVGITMMQFVGSLCISHFIYRGMMLGGQSRAVLIGMIYDKSMVISGRAKAGTSKDALSPEEGGPEKPDAEKSGDGKKSKKESKAKGGAIANEVGWANGRIVNLMSVDTYRIDQACALGHFIWTAPIACIVTLVLLLVNLTYSALAGFGLLVLGVPLLTKAIQSLFARRKMINKITDKRVSLTQEIIQSVRFVKYFGWETAFLERLAEIRSKEIYAIQILLATRNAINSVSMAMPVFASMLSFITYRLTNHGLAPAQVFSSLALFNSLRIPLNLLPLVLGQVIDAMSSIGRVEEFLLEEEQEEDIVIKADGEHAIEMNNASFTWERTKNKETELPSDPKEKKAAAAAAKEAKAQLNSTKPAEEDGPKEATHGEEREPFKLQDLNFTAGRKELLAVIGSVGCGKSSLLASLAGDMRKTEGEVVFGASRAFCPQYAWIQNTSLQNNITFGKPMEKAWYKEVIDACALRSDLDMLPNGDQTEIGERGITISGGQKQRLNIARAIYFNADIVLMDDPLSAVDAHVGRHIFDHAILGLLKDKCRILATHQLWVLNRCDRIIWMDGGKIRAIDTYDNLMRDEEGFRALMETNTVEKEEEELELQSEEVSEETEEVTKVERVETSAEDRAKNKKNKKQAMLMQQEERAEKSVPWSVYAGYVRASGSMFNLPFLALVLILSQGANIVTSLWLSWWTSDKFGYSDGVYIGVYASLGATQAFLMFAFSVLLTVLGTNASKSMLRDAVTRVLRAPMSFFDTTPLGRITNRFSRDVDVMDNNLTDAIRMFFFTLANVTAVFILTIAYYYYFAAALVPLYILYMIAGTYYRSSAREVKRYESVLRSSMFARFSEGLSGVSSIRAYGLRERFMNDLRKSIDQMNGAYYLTFSNQRWLSVRLDMIGNLLVFVVAILVVTSRFTVSPSTGGLVLSYMLSIVQMLQFSIRQLAEMENGMNAVERLRYYGHELEEEAPLHTIDVRPSWPEKGEIKFENVEMRYRPNLPLVLKGLSIHVEGGERIGVVGRTGAGKSSIMSTLFRLVEISSGKITIDGLNISTIGLGDLRKRLAIIPQDPTLFQGTVRSNLDPFQEHDDLALWSALRQADLVSADATLEDRSDPSRIHLDSIVEDEGLNFSLGQRQLMALARALVRGAQIIVCDEATSSVDMDTDDKIQRTMATGFRGKTLLCIAHRLRTIIGYDRICVMDAGRIAELDTPANLYRKPDGIFRGMCDRSGISLGDIETAAQTMAAIDSSTSATPRIAESSE